MKKIFSSVLLLSCMACMQSIYAQQPRLKTSQKVMNDFMDKRFGMFIHFGPVTLRATEIGWSRYSEVPQEEYDNLYKEFNPVLFNADAWVKAAKDAGMKYLVITSKHHDGFCLWPTKRSDYNIMNGPFKKDIVGELAKACKKQGIAFCIYMTVLDWHDSDYPIHKRGDDKFNTKGDMKRFVETMKVELKELITNYHPYMLWFDGYWEDPWKNEYGEDIYRYIKILGPDIIVNNRLGKGDHAVWSDSTVGDYLTPEQQVGKINIEHPWESCITICNQWSWKPNDPMKSLKECLQTLVRSAGGNGNLLFNVGPMMDGRMEARQVNRLKEMGDWLKLYGESIYGTKGGPYAPMENFVTTRKGNKIYLHIFDRKEAVLRLPVLPGVQITKAYFMKGNTVTFKQEDTGIEIELPAVLPESNNAVIVLELNKNAGNIPVINFPQQAANKENK